MYIVDMVQDKSTLKADGKWCVCEVNIYIGLERLYDRYIMMFRHETKKGLDKFYMVGIIGCPNETLYLN